ncbi:MAG: single-stranded DNA-binding protein [Terracidiphilus sp.]
MGDPVNPGIQLRRLHHVSEPHFHRCIVWGKLSDYAQTLTKGAHLAIDGELRSRERVDKKTSAKQRVWEVRVASILKLDRAEKAAPEEAEDSTPETTEDVPE